MSISTSTGWFVVKDGEDRKFDLKFGSNVVGRSTGGECDIGAGDSPYISRQSFSFEVTENGVFITDLRKPRPKLPPIGVNNCMTSTSFTLVPIEEADVVSMGKSNYHCRFILYRRKPTTASPCRKRRMVASTTSTQSLINNSDDLDDGDDDDPDDDPDDDGDDQESAQRLQIGQRYKRRNTTTDQGQMQPANDLIPHVEPHLQGQNLDSKIGCSAFPQIDHVGESETDPDTHAEEDGGVCGHVNVNIDTSRSDTDEGLSQLDDSSTHIATTDLFSSESKQTSDFQAFSFVDFPTELWSVIFSYLSPRDIMRLAQCSKLSNEIAHTVYVSWNPSWMATSAIEIPLARDCNEKQVKYWYNLPFRVKASLQIQRTPRRLHDPHFMFDDGIVELVPTFSLSQTKLQNYKNVNMVEHRGDSDLKVVPQCHGCFRAADVSGSHRLVDVTNLSTVQHVVADGCPVLVDVSSLAHCTSVSLKNCTNLRNVTALAKVRMLWLNSCKYISDVSTLGSVTYLNLAGCHSVRDVSALGSVRMLNLSGCKHVSDVSALTHVNTLNLSRCVKVTSCDGLAGVRCLNLSGTSISDVTPLGAADAVVETLDLANCRLVCDVSMLGRVRVLNLAYTRVRDVSALGSVHTLILKHCTEVKDVSALGDVAVLDL